MGGIVSGITDAVGLTNTKGEKKAAAAAQRASDQAYGLSLEQIEMAKAQVEFQREQYNDWKNIYGDIQANMGDYYKNLDPDKLVALGLENQQREYQAVSTALEKEYAQRGLSGSGTEEFLKSSSAVQNATAKAVIRSSGDKMVNEEKMKFLGLGLGQGTQMLGTVNNAASLATSAYSNSVNARTSTSNNYLQASTQMGIANQQMMGDLLGTAAGFIPK